MRPLLESLTFHLTSLSTRILELEADKEALQQRVKDLLEDEIHSRMLRSKKADHHDHEPLRNMITLIFKEPICIQGNGFVTNRRTPPIEHGMGFHPPSRRKASKKPPGGNNRRASYGGGIIEYRGPTRAEGRRSLGSDDGYN